MLSVVVIIPTYNESSNIVKMIEHLESLNKRLKGYSLNLLIVDDNSPDGTANLVKQQQSRFNNIDLVSGSKEGLGRAYIRGFKHALKNNNDYLIMMDADFSHDPEDILAMLDKLQSGYDYVIGSRYVQGSSIDQDWPKARLLSSKIANIVAKRLVGIESDIFDYTGGFKAIRQSTLKKINLNRIVASGYVFQVSLLHSFLAAGYKVTEVPITFKTRENGQSKIRPSDYGEFIYRAYKLNPDAPIQRFVRFCLVGGFGAIVNLFSLFVLVRTTRINTVLAAAIAIEISVIVNFFLNHLYTFRGYGANSRRLGEPFKPLLIKLAKYNMSAIGGAFISLTVFSFFFKLLHVEYLISDMIAILCATGWNYYMSTKYVWKVIDHTNDVI